ncbi:MAG: hypothetical protein ACXIU8_11760 [Alkalilacustris sp.]
MISSEHTQTGVDVTVEAEIEVAAAAQAQAALIDALASADPSRPARLDLSAPAAGAPALQLVAAARRSLEARGAFAGYGPVAAAQLPL